jgi:ferritin-like metal-binding protein YciE
VKTMAELFEHTLKDIYCAENAIAEALPKLSALGTTMQIAAPPTTKVHKSLNNIEARRHQTDATFRSITELEAIARRQKTERLKAARFHSASAEQ